MIIKVKCTICSKVNEVDLDKALERESILRLSSDSPPLPSEVPPLPERIVLDCRHCTAGKVILDRRMMEDALGQKSSED